MQMQRINKDPKETSF